MSTSKAICKINIGKKDGTLECDMCPNHCSVVWTGPKSVLQFIRSARPTAMQTRCCVTAKLSSQWTNVWKKSRLCFLLTCMSVKENEWQFDKTSNIFWQLDSKNADWVSQKGCVFFSKRHMTSATKKLTQTFTMFNKIKTVQMQNFSRHLFFMQRILCSSHSMLFVLTTNASQLWRMRDTEIPHSFFHSDNLIVALWVNAKWGWIPCLFLIEFVQQWKCDQRGCTVEKSNALDSSCLLNTWLVFESITNIHCALPRDCLLYTSPSPRD